MSRQTQIPVEEIEFLNRAYDAIQSGTTLGMPMLKNEMAFAVCEVVRCKMNELQKSAFDKSREFIAERNPDAGRNEIVKNLTGSISGECYDDSKSVIWRLLIMALSDSADIEICDIEFIVEWARILGIGVKNLERAAQGIFGISSKI
ncbi:MAG: hypothetical protein V4610_07635 [Pseudomonadota bacterium]|jgi:hypothetical protein